MEKATKIEKEMMTYIFKIVIEEDPFSDGQMAYHIYCPALKDYAASTWGYTREEAIKNIQEVIQMIIGELSELRWQQIRKWGEETSEKLNIKDEDHVDKIIHS